jgi:hypothetical protein
VSHIVPYTAREAHHHVLRRDVPAVRWRPTKNLPTAARLHSTRWWAHLEFTRINIEPTILRKKLEDLRKVGASSGEAPVPDLGPGLGTLAGTLKPTTNCVPRGHTSEVGVASRPQYLARCSASHYNCSARTGGSLHG